MKIIILTLLLYLKIIISEINTQKETNKEVQETSTTNVNDADDNDDEEFFSDTDGDGHYFPNIKLHDQAINDIKFHKYIGDEPLNKMDDDETILNGIEYKNVPENPTIEDYCESCSPKTFSQFIKVCVNKFPKDFSIPSTNYYLSESRYEYSDGELTNIICATTEGQKVTMTYYEYEGILLKKIFSIAAFESVESYLKLEDRNTPAYVECRGKVFTYPHEKIARLYFASSKRLSNLVQVNGLTLPDLCTDLLKKSISVHKYFALMNEPIAISLVLNGSDIECKSNAYTPTLFLSNDTHFIIGFVFDGHETLSKIKCYNKNNKTNKNVYYKMFQVYVYNFNKLFENTKIWIEGLQWRFMLEMYSTDHQSNTKTSTFIKYLYHGEELELICFAKNEVTNWANNDKVVYKRMNSVKCIKTDPQDACVFQSTVSFVVKQVYSNVQMKCTSNDGNDIVVEFVREKVYNMEENRIVSNHATENSSSVFQTTITVSKQNLTGYNSSVVQTTSTALNHNPTENNNSSVVQTTLTASNHNPIENNSSVVQTTIIIAVTSLVALVIVAFAVYKVVQVRNRTKLEQEIIAANRIYEPKYAENIYESVKYEDPKRAEQPSTGITQSSSLPILAPCEKQEENQPTVDISQRPPLPLPIEEENQPYIHYDTPYEYRLFRYGRRTGPPNRGRNIKKIH